MAYLMSDVAAGSDAALRLQQNMAAAPYVQQEQALEVQQKQANLERTKLANLVADTGIKADQIQPEYDGDPVPAQITALDSALNKVKTDHEFLSYVGLGTEYDITNFVPGSTFRFKGYRSTTINPNIALNYNSRVNKTVNRQQTVMLQIRVPKGAKGMFVEEFMESLGKPLLYDGYQLIWKW